MGEIMHRNILQVVRQIQKVAKPQANKHMLLVVIWKEERVIFGGLIAMGLRVTKGGGASFVWREIKLD
jgi:hypothetical protein